MDSISEMVFADVAQDLYDHVRYYGHESVEHAAYRMFLHPEATLINHWQDLRQLYESWDIFRSLAHEATAEEFCTYIDGGDLPKDFLLDRTQRVVWTDVEERKIQARFVLDFLLSLNDFFEAEVNLLSLGYIEPDLAA